VDRRLTLREILEKIFGLIPRFKSKDELLEEEFSKVWRIINPRKPKQSGAQDLFKAYITDLHVRHIIDEKNLPISLQSFFPPKISKPCRRNTHAHSGVY